MGTFLVYLQTLDAKTLFIVRIVLCACLVVAAVFGIRLLRRILAALERRLQPLLPRWINILFHGFTEPFLLLVRIVLLYLAVLAVPGLLIRTEVVWALLTPFVRAAAVLLIAWGFWRSAPLCRLLLRSAENHLDMQTNQTMGRFFENIYRVLVGTFSVLIVLEMFGVPVGSLVAGAGIAGLAVSLAAQSTLSNLIAGVTLVLEHPFGIGDYIVLGQYEGTVEDISFRSTRLRTPDKVVIYIENSKVCAEYIQNASDRDSRLWAFTLRLPYDTPYPNFDAFCKALYGNLQLDPQLHADRMLMTVDSVGEDGIKLLLRLYTTTADYNEYLRIRGRINREILLLLKEHSCTLAYPPASVYVEQTPPQ